VTGEYRVTEESGILRSGGVNLCCSRPFRMKQKITTFIVLVFAASSSLCLFLYLLKSLPGGYRSTQWALIASASAFLIASGIVFRRHRISQWIGLISGLGSVYWFCGIEFGYPFPALNTWIAFNLPDAATGSSQQIWIAKLKIAFSITALAATTISATRFLPPQWIMRKRPVRDRLWPALAICVLAALFWYALSVSPYRIPWIVDAASPKLTLLHVEKNGSQFHETSVSIFPDGQVYVSHNDRRLFHYRFPIYSGSAVLPDDNRTREAAFALGRQLADSATAPAVRLRSKKAEGWYVRIQHTHVLAFTTEYATRPPTQAIVVFQSLASAVSEAKYQGDAKDICFGFCYDPMAGLGLQYMNDRCGYQNGTHCK